MGPHQAKTKNYVRIRSNEGFHLYNIKRENPFEGSVEDYDVD
jgi:hypothetical protein